MCSSAQVLKVSACVFLNLTANDIFTSNYFLVYPLERKGRVPYVLCNLAFSGKWLREAKRE